MSPAHAIDELQLPSGAEGELVSVAAEGSHGVGAGPRSAQPTVPLQAGYGSAAILTRRSILRLCRSASDVPGLQLTSQRTVILRSPHPPSLLAGWCLGEES